MGILRRKSRMVFIISALLLAGAPALAVSQSEFLELCLTGGVMSVAEALQAGGVSLTAADSQGNTPLMMAAQARGEAADPAKIRLLVSAGANISARNREGMRALTLAARASDNPEVIIELVRAGAQLEEKGPRDWTAMSFAAARNPNPSIVNVLFDLGADINAQDNAHSTPIILAVRAGNTAPVLNALLDNGADPLLPNSSGKTPAEFLDAKKFAPEELDALKARMQKDNAPSPAEPERFAAVCRRGVERRVRYFLDARTDPNAGFGGLAPLMIAAQDNVCSGVLATLIRYGAQPDATDAQGRTALIHAARSGHNPGALNELLIAGARADCRDEDGKNALDYAAANATYAPGDIQLLANILSAVAEAEKRGVQIEIDRRNNDDTEPSDVTRLGELYGRMSADQAKIVRLTEEAAQARRDAGEAARREQAANDRIANLEKALAEQKQAEDALTAELEAAGEEHGKDIALARENVSRLTALWQGEVQKNAKFAEEAAQSAQKLTEEFAAERARLEEQRKAEAESLRAQLAAESEKLAKALEAQSAADLRQQRDAVAAEDKHARQMDEARKENARQLTELKEQHSKELRDALAAAEQKRAAEVSALAARAQEHETEALQAERERHAAELTQLRRALDSERSEQAAGIEARKNSELRQKTDAFIREIETQKKQFSDVLTMLNAFLRRERSASSKAAADLRALKAKSEKEKTAFQEHLRRQQLMNDAALADRLAEQEENLRAEFDAETARIREEYRAQLRDAAARIEAQAGEEIARLKRQHQEELNRRTSELYEAIEKYKTTARALSSIDLPREPEPAAQGAASPPQENASAGEEPAAPAQ